MAGAAATPSPHQIAADPAYLAYPLARYQRAEQLSDEALAAELAIAVERLDRLRRCRLPAVDPYAVRLYRLIEAFGVDVRALTRVLLVAGMASWRDHPGRGATQREHPPVLREPA